MSETYPEHEKLIAIKAESQCIGEFLDWLRTRWEIAEWVKDLEELHVVHTPINNILAIYFDIDLKKLEEEKQAMLKTLSFPYSLF